VWPCLIVVTCGRSPSSARLGQSPGAGSVGPVAEGVHAINRYLTGCAAFAVLIAPVLDAKAQEANDAYRRIEPPMQLPARSMRILVYYDMEGLAGQADWRSFFFRYEAAYRQGQKFLIADVNAVIEGLFEGGATEVHVVDSHGSGNPEPDLPIDKLDSRAKPVLRNEQFESYSGLVEKNAFDAVVAVGMHARTGTSGFAAHTYEFGKQIAFNGRALSETEIIAFSWGRVGVPVIFVSGDDAAKLDLSDMPWLEYVTVKKSRSTTEVELLPVDVAHRQLREGARRAVVNRARARAVKVAEPVQVRLRTYPPASLAMLEGVPGIDYRDNEVSFVAPDFASAYKGVEALIRVSNLEYNQVLYNVIRKRPERREIFFEYLDSVATQGITASVPSPTPGAAAVTGKPRPYFGEQ